MTINQQPKAAMDAANSFPDPGALEGARRATEDAPGSAAPTRAPDTDSEVVPRARRRQFSNADKRRIVEAADRCTKPGEIGALMRREGVYSSSLSTWRRQREAAELAALAPPKARTQIRRESGRGAAHRAAHTRARSPQEPTRQGPAGDRRPKKLAALLGNPIDDDTDKP